MIKRLGWFPFLRGTSLFPVQFAEPCQTSNEPEAPPFLSLSNNNTWRSSFQHSSNHGSFLFPLSFLSSLPLPPLTHSIIVHGVANPLSCNSSFVQTVCVLVSPSMMKQSKTIVPREILYKYGISFFFQRFETWFINGITRRGERWRWAFPEEYTLWFESRNLERCFRRLLFFFFYRPLFQITSIREKIYFWSVLNVYGDITYGAFPV